jgi:hypothetical protein
MEEDGVAPSPDARSVQDDLVSRHHAFQVISGIAAFAAEMRSRGAEPA